MTEEKSDSPFVEELVDDKTPVTALLEPAPSDYAAVAQQTVTSPPADGGSHYEAEVRFLVFRLEKTETALAEHKAGINWLLLLLALLVGVCGILIFQLRYQAARQNTVLQTLVAGAKSKVPPVSFSQWEQGQPPVKLIKASEGWCFLTKVTGNFQGGGESIRLWVASDGYWYLGGESHQQGIGAECAVIKY